MPPATGKSRRLAVLVTLVAIIGVLPYIALQLKAVTLSFDYVLKDGTPGQVDTALVVAALMALFTLLFGTRHIDTTEHQSGLMLAVSFESFIKVVAFVLLGLYCLYSIFDGPMDLWAATGGTPGCDGNLRTHPVLAEFCHRLAAVHGGHPLPAPTVPCRHRGKQ